MSTFSFFGDEDTSSTAISADNAPASAEVAAASLPAALLSTTEAPPSRASLARYLPPPASRTRLLATSVAEAAKRAGASWPAFVRPGTAAEVAADWQAHRAELALNFKLKAKLARRVGRKRAGEKTYI